MIPYFEIPSIPLFGPLRIHAFGLLVAIGILVGARLLVVRARQLGLDEQAAAALATYVVVAGFIVSHVFDVVAYEPERLLRDPLFLFRSFSISSFGGFLGGIVGLYLWRRKYQKPLLPYADSTAFGLAFGWFFGRLGCFSAHDHPGRKTDFFFSLHCTSKVGDPNWYCASPSTNGFARFDLGMMEALFTALLCLGFALAFRKPRRPGVYLAAACLFYPPVRFFLDVLRATDVAHPDARYFGFTPGQYAAVAMFLYGVALTVRLARVPPAIADANQV